MGNNSSLVEAFASGILLCVVAFVPLATMTEKSPAFDEVVYVPAGHSYWQTGRVLLNPEHPPLVKLLCALPLQALGMKSLPPTSDLERGSTRNDFQWAFGTHYLFAQDVQRVMTWARLPIVALSVALAILIWGWARELWGPSGGLLALFLYAFDPTVLTHASLVGLDLPFGFFTALFGYSLWRASASPSIPRVVAVGLTLGLVLATRFTGMILIPAALAVCSSRLRREPLLTIALWSTVLVCAGVVVWMAYLCPRDLWFYWNGIQAARRESMGLQEALLAGQTKWGGWWYYLPVAAALKSPVTLILLGLASTIAAFLGHHLSWKNEWPVLIPASMLFLFHTAFANCIGVRYILCILPLTYVFCARLGPIVLRSGTFTKVVVAGLLLWQAMSVAAVFPDHHAYFNEVAGGPTQGYRWLDDSNVDWGQGLVQLARDLGKDSQDTYRFYYFGSGQPAYYGIQPRRCEGLWDETPTGRIIVSAHCLSRWLAAVTKEYGSNHWLHGARASRVVGHAYYVFDWRTPAAPNESR